MKFTLIFSSPESRNLSYGLVFTPCPVWVKGDREVLNLNPERPDYQAGSLRRLLEKERLLPMLANKQCVLVIHPVGHGREQDLQTLLRDLEAEGFQVKQTSL